EPTPDGNDVGSWIARFRSSGASAPPRHAVSNDVAGRSRPPARGSRLGARGFDSLNREADDRRDGTQRSSSPIEADTVERDGRNRMPAPSDECRRPEEMERRGADGQQELEARNDVSAAQRPRKGPLPGSPAQVSMLKML